ncbi:WRKY transcription factor 23-1 [Tripterygium wilfordii]|uniref:WRKY transcription factor 23-1 n=1 Tax=Tripterygium wilfordii TaxID=458696 RepID=A0A7J7CGC3_TRIWF|nr:WRKY transcription factor 23-1 [Tripterygium wilfordii]
MQEQHHEAPPPPPSMPLYDLFAPPALMLPSSSILRPPPPPSTTIDHQQVLVFPENIDWVSAQSGLMVENYKGLLMEKSSGCAQKPNGGGEEKIITNNNIKDKRKPVTNSSRNRMRKASKLRFAFQTKSADDILDEGYRWRKYGQKSVKNSIYPSYVDLIGS